jgi:hypothetical protein
VDVSWYLEDKRVGDGVRWSANRLKAFKLTRGTKKETLSLDEAMFGDAGRRGEEIHESKSGDDGVIGSK